MTALWLLLLLMFHCFSSCTSLRKKCPCSQFFWSVFSRVRIENLSILTLNARKYGVEKLRIRTLFTQCRLSLFSEVYSVDVPYILGNSVFLYLCNYLISINEISPQRLILKAFRFSAYCNRK